MSKSAHLATSIAAGQVSLVNFAPSVDPDGRGVWDYTYEGTDAGISVLSNSMLRAGAKIRTNYGPGVASLTASFSYNPGADPADAGVPATVEAPVDRYSVHFGAVQVSLFVLPYATYEAKDYSVRAGVTLANYKKTITDAVNQGVALDINSAQYPFAHVIYRQLSHGVEFATVDRPTLRRTRTYSYAYAERRRVTFDQIAYTTSRLASQFGIPNDILAVLPFDPSGVGETPDVSAWGWRIADQDLTYNPTSRKWEESVTWEYAAYDGGLFVILT